MSSPEQIKYMLEGRIEQWGSVEVTIYEINRQHTSNRIPDGKIRSSPVIKVKRPQEQSLLPFNRDLYIEHRQALHSPESTRRPSSSRKFSRAKG